MPTVPVVDAHVHLWDPEQFRMSWLDSTPLLNQRYLLPEYEEHTRGIDIQSMVYMQVEVETPYAYLEAAFVCELAKQDRRIQAIVAWAPLEYGDRSRVFLEALVRLSPLIKGIRRIIQFETDPGFCLRTDFVRGVHILSEYGLTFDICIDHRQMSNAIALVRQCPNTSFILDHIGKPDIRNHAIEPWKRQLVEMAGLPNVACKISGLVTEANHNAWTPEDLRPFIGHVLDCFGEDRVLFGSDWPVVLQASAYDRWADTLNDLSSHLSSVARAKLWVENARRIYRLPKASTCD